jgi:hypothetical protein
MFANSRRRAANILLKPSANTGRFAEQSKESGESSAVIRGITAAMIRHE